ncbi:MAG: tetratricopeptide repeat protein [Candidatus Omnitrophota bacterium]
MKKFIPRFFCVISIIIFLSIFISPLFATTLEIYLRDGIRCAQSGDTNKAIRIYKEGIEAFPDNYELYFCLGCAYRDKGDYNEALRNILQSVTLADEVPSKIHEGLARIYIELGKKRHYTRELTLRLIYHAVRLIELNPELEGKVGWLSGLGRYLIYYEEANKGGVNFLLPRDAISKKEKLEYLEKAKKIVEEYKAEKLKKKGLQSNQE